MVSQITTPVVPQAHASSTVNSAAVIERTTSAPNAESSPAATPENTTVTLSARAMALANGESVEPEEPSTYDNVKNFTYAALGLDRPEGVAEDDGAYQAGKTAKAVATVVSLGLLL